ncbi:MAG: methylenetetrahydrofolate reductase, partial [Methanimicrococcus sp.]|nr:methylenetetrahydrofolate reductase [Methanimicrococcus sp.]
VYDLDSIQLLKLIQKMKQGSNFSDQPLFGAPDFCVGVVTNADPAERMQLVKLEKKLVSGVDFIQTQAVFDIEKFKAFLEKANTDVPILAGVIPIRSAQMMQYMNQNVPGIAVPDELSERILAAEDPIKEGISIASDLIVKLKPLCRGIHMMPVGSHISTEKILKAAHLL